MRKIKFIIGSCVVLAFVGLFSGLSAQTTTSTIEGTVTDSNGAVIAGATVKATGTTLATERSATTDSQGFYRLTALPAGTYTLTISQSGFATEAYTVELTLNRVARFDAQLKVGGNVTGQVTVTSELPLLTSDTPATGMTVTPRQIEALPVNGRNYLDLLQLVPGVAVNRQADPQGDNANPVLGERSGNNNFFIDGQPNKNTVNGGPAAQFNQETIAEFQVLTTGYKAEFGQASGAIVNVITKSGGNGFHGMASFFHRNDALDSSNSLDPTKTDAPPLRRFDYSAALGGPIVKDKMFFFTSAERITENRQIDFTFPNLANPTVNQLIHDLESSFDVPNRVRETRLFLKLNEQLGRHSLSEEVNYTNGNNRNFGALFAGTSLPSTRTNRGFRNLLLAFGDTILLGDQGDPWVVTLRGAYRGEPSDVGPAHPETGGGSTLVPYNIPVTSALQIPGPLGTASFGSGATASALDQKYTSLTAIADKRFGNHEVKFGWNYLRTKVDGFESRVLQNQLYVTVPDFLAFDPAVAGIRLVAEQGGVTPRDDEIHLLNNYNALFAQDDWKILKNLTASFGVRWDYDSQFKAKRNFAPRLGVTWGITPKTVIRSQFGIFYDQFRLGIARDVPPFGGANQQLGQVLIFPRGLYGAPNFISSAALLLLGSGPCFSNVFLNNATDAQIAGGSCPFRASQPLIGVDRLNNVVAAGHAPIPANTVITMANIQSLSGLTPEQYLTQANAAIGFPGYFTWGSTGLLTNRIIPPFGAPQVLENIDKTPNTLAFSVGVQQEIGKDMVVEADYHHREIRNILGERITNLAFKSRVSGRSFDPPGTQVVGFGPYFKGRYDALVLALNRRLSNRFTFGVNYTFAHETDNSRGVNSPPSDNFIGIVPVVTEASTGKTNANGSFVAANG
ncbi:MAG TPA: TonB-dependent receptor, partial [Pyrinomonadaceae bacterium]|nr:TonB-dependent receptor [Pyrinomonadaceae bacterium]